MKYRIIEKTRVNWDKFYHIQYRFLFMWFYYKNCFGNPWTYDSENDAIRQINHLIWVEDKEERILKYYPE